MIPYSKFQPTPFDHEGHCLPDRQDWLVAPVGRNRDTSEPIDVSNWRVLLKSLPADREGEDWEVHSFGHWACGWFEILLVRPGSESARIAQEAEDALADYPVLDEEDYSLAEHENAAEVWENCFDDRERIDMLRNRLTVRFGTWAELTACVRGKSPPYCERIGFEWAGR